MDKIINASPSDKRQNSMEMQQGYNVFDDMGTTLEQIEMLKKRVGKSLGMFGSYDLEGIHELSILYTKLEEAKMLVQKIQEKITKDESKEI